MTDLELLFLVLGLVYLWECACWMPRGSVAFRTWLGRRWGVAHPSTLFGNQRAGFIFAHPLPPLGTLLTANQYPWSLSPDGILAFVASSINPGWRPVQSGRFLRLDDIRRISVRGKKILVDDLLLLKVASPSFAAHLGAALEQLKKLPPMERAAFIEKSVRDSLDIKAIQRRWHDFQTQTTRLRWLTNTLFAWLFLFAPILIWRFGLGRCWLGLLLGLLACTIPASFLFRRAHKFLFPAAEDERFTHFLLILLSPATSIRALDVLARPLLEQFHPLAIAAVFCSTPQLGAFARAVWREIRYPALPLCPCPEPAAQAAERHWRLTLQHALETLLKQSGIEPSELLQPPARSDATCRAYCPHCLAQFTSIQGVCDDCGGVPRIAF